ncbi:acyltransferase family protein [Massilia sp. TN1-12]|uniref:acyltransferase family protein n=1 Tax=Massilia paldalensis TaxID=3377675 RepID=UPI00384EE35B
MHLAPDIAKRISILRTVLILFVVLLHIGTPNVKALDGNDLLQLARFFFQDELGRLAVPTLTMVSGYLLFASGLDLAPLKLYAKKIRTLLVPFFFFNIVYFAVQYGIEYTTGWAPLYLLVSKPDHQILNYLFNYDGIPLNGALHFLRDLFVLVLLAPLFGYFMRRMPTLGLILVIAVFMNDLDGHLVNCNTMAVLFYIGGMAATGRWDVRRLDRFAVPALALLAAVCIGTIYFRVDDYVYIYLTAPLAVWPASSLLLGTRFGDWAANYSKYSFLLFLTHTPLIRLAENLCAHYGASVLDIGYAAPTFLVLVGITPLAYAVAMRAMPRTFCVLVGGRARKPEAPAGVEPVGAVPAR